MERHRHAELRAGENLVLRYSPVPVPHQGVAGGEGFEPPERLRARRFSGPVHSTALPPTRKARPARPGPLLAWRENSRKFVRNCAFPEV